MPIFLQNNLTTFYFCPQPYGIYRSQCKTTDIKIKLKYGDKKTLTDKVERSEFKNCNNAHHLLGNNFQSKMQN